MSLALMENVWMEGPYYRSMADKFHAFEAKSQQKAGGDNAARPASPPSRTSSTSPTSTSSSILNQIQQTRQNIQKTLNSAPSQNMNNDELINRIAAVEKENKVLKTEFNALTDRFLELEARLGKLVSGAGPAEKVEAKVEAKVEEEEEEDDDIDLFASDDDDEEAAAEAERIKAERIADYNNRKSAKEAKKGVLIAKSSILLDVKPWDDETDMAELEAAVRAIQADGLVWGAGKLVAVGYGIKKLQICCVVEDDKVGTDFLEESITAEEDLVQSVDIAAFNKI